MIDLLPQPVTARIHNHGFIRLVDVMPRVAPNDQTGDSAIVQAARVSYGQGTKTPSDDRTLIRYLMRHHHTTPFEMAETKWHIKAPIFIARQWMRHRMASINEVSARYSEVPDDQFWLPDEWRSQSQSNKQGSGEPIEYGMNSLSRDADVWEYRRRLDAGVSREQARTCLPVSTYTEWYWKIDLHNLLHFLRLRCDSHAQQEIRDYAHEMLAMIRPIFPHSVEAFEDYRMGSVTLSRLEIEAIRAGRSIASENKRECQEFADKKKTLGLE